MVVLGIGINVNQKREELPDARVARGSLRTVDGVVRERAPILALPARAARARATTAGSRAGSTRSSTGSARATSCAGGEVTVDGVSGNAVGITRAGGLVVEVDGERRLVEAAR